MGLGVDANNRQLHPIEEKLIKSNSRRFAQILFKTDNPTTDQVEAAQVMLANTAQNLVDNNIGYLVPYFKIAEEFLRLLQVEYAQTSPSLDIPNSNGQKLFFANDIEKSLSQLNINTAHFKKSGVIVMTPISNLNPNSLPSNSQRDVLTGLPLDQKGRYTQIIAVDERIYSPKYFACAIPECLGKNLDMSDNETQAYVKALDKKILEDLNTGANLLALASPTSLAGAIAGTASPVTSVVLGHLDGEPDKAGLKELSQVTASQYLQKIYGLTNGAATRITALIDLTGGWQRFVDRIYEQRNKNKSDKNE